VDSIRVKIEEEIEDYPQDTAQQSELVGLPLTFNRTESIRIGAGRAQDFFREGQHCLGGNKTSLFVKPVRKCLVFEVQKAPTL
jgi:hypothetical protein